MARGKFEVVVFYSDWLCCYGTAQPSDPDEPMEVYSFTTREDAEEFGCAVRDDACGWWRTCVFWTSEDAVKYVRSCVGPGSGGEQPDEDPEPWPDGLVVMDRPAAWRGGAPDAGEIEVFAVYGWEGTIQETVEDEGLDAAVHAYTFSTMDDVPEFLRALVTLQHWRKAMCLVGIKLGCPAQEETQGAPA